MTTQKRDIFGELMDGVRAMKRRREGRLILRSYSVRARSIAGGRSEPNEHKASLGTVHTESGQQKHSRKK